jgi:hypothetical protein
MHQNTRAFTGSYQGIPTSPRALIKLVGTSLLAGIVCAMFGGGVAYFLGVSAVVAGSVAGIVGASAVGLIILRHGQAP